MRSTGSFLKRTSLPYTGWEKKFTAFAGLEQLCV
jgi:hypothetical protein